MVEVGVQDEPRSGLDGATSPQASLTRVVASTSVCGLRGESTYIRIYWPSHSAWTPEEPRMEPKGLTQNDEPIRVVHPLCCGLDVHKDAVQACLLVTTAGGRVRQEQRSFGTTTE